MNQDWIDFAIYNKPIDSLVDIYVNEIISLTSRGSIAETNDIKKNLLELIEIVNQKNENNKR